MDTLPPPLLASSRLKLVPPDREYWETIRQWESDPSEMHLWTHRRDLPTRDQFEEAFSYRLRHYYFSYFVVLNAEGEPSGFVYLYENRGESAFLTAYVSPGNRGSIVAIQAVCMLLHWAFALNPLDRILADTFSYNEVSERNLQKAGFVQTGEIKRHRLFLGEFHTLKQWELPRESFYERHGALLERLLGCGR